MITDTTFSALIQNYKPAWNLWNWHTLPTTSTSPTPSLLSLPLLYSPPPLLLHHSLLPSPLHPLTLPFSSLSFPSLLSLILLLFLILFCMIHILTSNKIPFLLFKIWCMNVV